MLGIDYDDERILEAIDIINQYSHSSRGLEERYLMQFKKLVLNYRRKGMDTQGLEDMMERAKDSKLMMDKRYNLTLTGERNKHTVKTK